jgi:hypothetical protein
MKILSLALAYVFLLPYQCLPETSQDTYITKHGTEWTIGSAVVEMTIGLRNGMLVTTSFKNKGNGHELAPSDSTGPWTLVEGRTSKLKQGELQLDLTLRREGLTETKSYVVYPGSSIIRQWAELKNVGLVPLKVSDPEFLNTSARLGDPASVDFEWMTGGNNAHGSWVLKTEKLSVEKSRTFDSNDPFSDPGVCGDFLGGQANVSILLNGKQIWPSPWQLATQSANRVVPIEASAQVQTGDRVMFLVAPNRAFDTLQFDPTIRYSDDETHVASKEFSTQQGANGWRYEFAEGGNLATW